MNIKKTYKDLTETVGAGLAIAFAILAIIAFLCMVPALMLWSVNSLAEAGGVDFYISHNIWNYFVAFVFIAIVRGGK